MESSWAVNCHAWTPVNGDTNLDQDTTKSSSNSFLPAGFIQHFPSDNSGSTINRYPDDNPVWQEVAKRYQQILEKEYELLSTCPIFRDGQIIPQNTPVSPAVNASSRPNKKDRHHKPVGEKSALTCKLTEKQTNAYDVIIEEHLDSSVTKKMEDNVFPKIVEVYSLSSPKIQAEETENRKRKYAQDVSSCINEESLQNGTKDGDPQAPWSNKKPCIVSDNFIDLTVDDEEETIECRSDDKAVSSGKICKMINVNGNYQSELEQPKEDKDEKGMEWESSKCNTGKGKGVFSHRMKGKRNDPTHPQQRDTGKTPTDAGYDESATTSKINNDHSDSSQHKNQYANGHAYEENNHTGDRKGTLYDQNNNNKVRKETSEENKQNSDSSMLNMSYRENKITNLKARLAKQEEELAKLKTLKTCEKVAEKSQQTPLNHASVENSEQKENSRIEIDKQKKEHTPGTVNLNDICQHVIKSFDIFNARICKDGRQVFKKTNSNKSQANANGYSHHGSVNKQDEFLFQFGLRRKSC